LCFLDPRDQVPQEFIAKAGRYGWPTALELLPVWLVAGPDGPADLDQLNVRRLTLGLAAVVGHHRRSIAKTTGTLVLADGRRGTYSIG
jgi:hypothetical protein